MTPFNPTHRLINAVDSVGDPGMLLMQVGPPDADGLIPLLDADDCEEGRTMVWLVHPRDMEAV